MSINASITIKGLDELEAKLHEFADVTVKSELETAMKNGLLKIETSAVHNADQAPPQHPQVQTGRLKEDIMSEWFWTSDLLQGNCGSNVEYGPDLEYGHVQGHGQGSQKSVTYQGVEHSTSNFIGPYPWLQPALEENIDAIQLEFEQAIARAVVRASGG